MNDLERATYCEPDFSLANEFVNETMSEEEKEATRKKTLEMYNNFYDDEEIAHLGECF